MEGDFLPFSEVNVDGDKMKKVVLVEDQPEVRAVLTDVLKFLDCQVLGFSRFEDALSPLEKPGQKPDLLISDIYLGQNLGTELASVFRHQFPELPVLFISGFPKSSLPVKIDGDMDYFLQKPFSIKILQDLLEQVFQKVSSS